MKTPLFKAGVIGGGAIGGLLDLQEPLDRPQTHAGGYRENRHFELTGICDKNPSPLLNLFNCRLYSDVVELLEKEKPEVLSVAVPEAEQYSILRILLEYPNIRAVVCEKPIAKNFQQARSIVEEYERAGVPLIVNFTRRYSNLYQEMANKFFDEKETPISCTIRYAKGLWHNGTHAIDLARMLFGEVRDYIKLNQTYDYFDEDGTVTGFLSFERCSDVFIQALNEQYFTHFEVDIFTDRSRYVFHSDHRKLDTFFIQEDIGYPLGKRLVFNNRMDTDYEMCMTSLIHHLYEVLTNKERPCCSGRNALKTLKIANALACK